MTDIKSMGLYQNVERVLADLAADGHGTDGPLTVADLTSYDQYHYEGTDAVDDAGVARGAVSGGHIIDIGSGLGGPARYMAEQTGVQVTALELQPDLNEVATSLTRRCGLQNQVSHLVGDVTAGDAPARTFSGLMSMLCFLHIPDRETLFRECAASLIPGAGMFIDDYYERELLTDADRSLLAEKVYCPYLPTLDRYVTDVEGAGFGQVQTVDKTEDWTAFVVDRLARFRSASDGLSDRYGAETVAELDDFYSAVVELFVSGRLGGVRLTASLT